MELSFLLRGLLIGFSIAAPVGPIGVLCIRRTLVEGRLAGLVSGLGAAAADAVYGCIAAFGLTFLSDILVGQQLWLRLIGGVFLLRLGWQSWHAPAAVVGRNLAEEDADSTSGTGDRHSRTPLRAWSSSFLLTLTNPVTILSFAGVFAGLGLTAADSTLSAGVLVLGVFCGSAAWWLLLSGGVSRLRERFDARAMARLNHISGLILAGFGAYALLGAVQHSWR